jgi:hypothetical protein
MEKKTIILTSGTSAMKLLFFVIKLVTATDKYFRLVLTSKALDGLKQLLHSGSSYLANKNCNIVN